MEESKWLTTQAAFEQMISVRGWWKDLELTKGTANSIVSRFRNNEMTIDKIEAILDKAGYRVAREKLWEPTHITNIKL